MTTIITRLYKDDSAANAVVASLTEAGFPEKTFDVIGGGDAAEQMTAARVSDAAAAAYAPLVGQGNKLVVVRAPITPFGAAKRAMSIVDSQETVDAGLENENEYVREMMPDAAKASPYGGAARMSAAGQDRRWSQMFGHIPLIMNYDRQGSVFTGTKRFGAFLVPLLKKKTPRKSAFSGTKRFGAFLFPLLNKFSLPGQKIIQGDKRFGDFLVPLLIKNTDGAANVK